MIRPRRQHHVGDRRAFALPLVVLLSLVVGVMTTVMLERQAAQTRLTQHQVHAALARHMGLGIREVVGQWSISLLSQPVENMLAVDGHAADLVMPGGEVAEVYLFDGQGSVMADVSKLAGRDAQDAAGILEQLAASHGGAPPEALLRRVGPVVISAASAPPEVLEAVVLHLKGNPHSARRFAQDILEARSRGPLTDADLATAANAADLKPEDRTRLLNLVKAKPTLWRVEVDFYSPVGSGGRETLSGRFAGEMIIGGEAAGQGSATIQSLGPFLAWRELPIE